MQTTLPALGPVELTTASLTMSGRLQTIPIHYCDVANWDDQNDEPSHHDGLADALWAWARMDQDNLTDGNMFAALVTDDSTSVTLELPEGRSGGYRLLVGVSFAANWHVVRALVPALDRVCTLAVCFVSEVER